MSIEITMEEAEILYLDSWLEDDLTCQAKHRSLSRGTTIGPCSHEVKWIARKLAHPRPRFNEGVFVCDNFKVQVMAIETGWTWIPV